MDAAGCQTLAQQSLDQCQAACGGTPSQTCTEICESKAVDKHDLVLESGRPEHAATRKGQQAYRRCVRIGCPH